MVIADPVIVLVSCAWTTALTEGIEGIPVAIARADWASCATAFQHLARTVAHTTVVRFSYTRIDVVANPVLIEVSSTIATAFSEGIGCVSIAIAGPELKPVTPALQHRPRAVAHATVIKRSHAGIDVVADSVLVHVRGAGSATDAKNIELVSVAIALPFRDVVAAALQDVADSIADTTCVVDADTGVNVVAKAIVVLVYGAASAAFSNDVFLVPIAIAIAGWNVGATTVVDCARAIAYAACIDLTYTRIEVVANAILVAVFITISTAFSEGVDLVSIAIAITIGEFRATAIQSGPGTVAHATFIEFSHTGVDAVADAVLVEVGVARATTHAKNVELVSCTIAVSIWDVVAAALKNIPDSIANAAGIVGANTRVNVVADAIVVLVFSAASATFSDDVFLVSVTIAVAGWNFGATAVVDIAGTIAHAADVKLAHTRITVVANPVLVAVFSAIASAYAKGIRGCA